MPSLPCPTDPRLHRRWQQSKKMQLAQRRSRQSEPRQKQGRGLHAADDSAHPMPMLGQQASGRPRPGAEPTPPAPLGPARRLRPGAPAAHAPAPHGHGPGCPPGKCSQRGLFTPCSEAKGKGQKPTDPPRPPRSSSLEGSAAPGRIPLPGCSARHSAVAGPHRLVLAHTRAQVCTHTLPHTRTLTHTHNFTRTHSRTHTNTASHTRPYNARITSHGRTSHAPAHTRAHTCARTHALTSRLPHPHTCALVVSPVTMLTLRRTPARTLTHPPPHTRKAVLRACSGWTAWGLLKFSASTFSPSLGCLSFVHVTFPNLCCENVFDIWECLLSKFQVGLSAAKHSVSWTGATVRGQGGVCAPNRGGKQREAWHGPSPRAPPQVVPESAPQPRAGPGAPTSTCRV